MVTPPSPRDLTMVTIPELQTLWGQFRSLPYQAISARLADAVPVDGDWKPEDTVWFNQRISDKQFVSVVKSVVGTATEPVVVLSLVDTSHPSEDRFVAQELVQVRRRRIFLILQLPFLLRPGELRLLLSEEYFMLWLLDQKTTSPQISSGDLDKPLTSIYSVFIQTVMRLLASAMLHMKFNLYE